jgi:hydrogenase maturation factor
MLPGPEAVIWAEVVVWVEVVAWAEAVVWAEVMEEDTVVVKEEVREVHTMLGL